MSKEEIHAKHQARLKKWRISYYYLATGMEGIPQTYPEKIIEAPTKEMAAFIYCVMFMASTNIKQIESIMAYDGADYARETYHGFLETEDVYKYWGMTIKEVTDEQG